MISDVHRRALIELGQQFAEFANCGLKHVLVDWLECAPDPTRMTFRLVAGPGVPEPVEGQPNVEPAIIELFSTPLKPEFTLAQWRPNKGGAYKPRRVFRHWVTAGDGDVSAHVSHWMSFMPLATTGGELLGSLGVVGTKLTSLSTTSEPLGRWFLAMHEVAAPNREYRAWSFPSPAEKGLALVPSPDAIVVGGQQFAIDCFGCQIIEDIGESSLDLIAWILDRGIEGDVDANAAEIKLAAGERTSATGEVADAPISQERSKRSTERGEGRAKLVAALTKHHQYADGGCLNLTPIGVNELARKAEVAASTATEFFNKEFSCGQPGGHRKYRQICVKDASLLVACLKTLNGEFSPHHLYGTTPPREKERED